MPHSPDLETKKTTCFKTYDVRGEVGRTLTEDMARRIGRATVVALKAKRLAVGCDVRLSSPMLKAALIRGMCEAGCDVVDLGLTGTEEIYFASAYLDVDGGVEVTASHNPAHHNGFKFVGRAGLPLRLDEEFAVLRQLAETDGVTPSAKPGMVKSQSLLVPYVDHLLAQVDLAALRPHRVVLDAGNGAAGHVVDEIERRFKHDAIPVTFIKVNHEPDGNFPQGVPNPLLPGNRAMTQEAVREHKADLGIAWDGDFDRCFFYDASGRFISGYYVSGLLMSHFLERHGPSTMVVDSRLNWNSFDIVKAAGGQAVPSKTGHLFFKEVMRREQAAYGGEVSAHHYFKSFSYCDSGMLPWLLVLEYLSRHRSTLAEAVDARMGLYPSSEEINFEVPNPQAAVAAITELYRNRARTIDFMDGVSIELGTVRFNLRASNTENLLRLNVEARGSAEAVSRCVGEIEKLVASLKG